VARAKLPVDEEQKSYSVVFLLAVGLLLAGAIWTIWDDNISRRPWKKFQTQFFGLEVDKAKQALAEEDARLAKDPTYQDVVHQLAAAQESLESGEAAHQLAELERRRHDVKERGDEFEFKIRIVKSKLEEAWYDYEHAKLTQQPLEAAEARIKVLDEEKARYDEGQRQAEAELKQIDSDMAEIRSVLEKLTKQKAELDAKHDALQLKLDGLTLHAGPFEFTKIPKIDQVVLYHFDRNHFDEPINRVDRCQSCHTAIDKVGFESEPNPFKTHPHREVLLAKHPPDKFGCTPCHGGQGAAVNSVETAHGEVKFAEHPLRRGDMVQQSCIQCHSNLRLPGAETVARGENLFEQLGCIGCHLVEGYGDLEKVGPYLRRISAKVNPAWLVEWVQNPHQYRPNTRMPNFMFNREQATAIAAYLLSVSKVEGDQWLAAHPGSTAVDPGDAAKVAKGKELANSIGCRGCHAFAPGESLAHLGQNKDIAPNLSNVADKTSGQWIYNWLKGPRGYSPVARMPSLRLSDDEAAALTSYLLTLGSPVPEPAGLGDTLQSKEQIAAGEKLVRKYGCGGCHDVPGMEGESRIGVELTTFGSKPLEELFFGYHTDIPETWYNWTYNKLKTPRTYQTERIEQVMPQFDLADEDIRALVVFLASRQDELMPATYKPPLEPAKSLVDGRRVVARYNCVGCHVIEERGGAIRALYEENPTMAPPILNGEGAKVQSDWLFGFLKQPISLRPWLKLRMPTFGLSDQETAALADYFMAQSSVHIPFVYVDVAAFPESYVEAGKLLTSPEYFNCFSCHQQGDKKPEGPQEGWAPDLSIAHKRLNPAWIIQWLRNPQAIQPGTKMPSFYNFDDPAPDGPEDILGGSDEKQVEALRDYIMTLHSSSAPVVAEAAHTGAAVTN